VAYGLTEKERNYYASIKEKMMRRFDLGAGIQRRFLARRFSARKAREWMAETRRRFETLIPQIPYIGGQENEFTKYLIYPAGIMPLAEILRREGATTREIGQVIFDMAASAYNALPAPVKWYMRWDYFREKRIARWRETAERSQRRRYPGDWVCEFVEGDGGTSVYGLNMSECGMLKLWRAQGLEELVPYMCLTDWALWRAIGVKVTRTQTLANGGTCCDYRYIGKGRSGPSGWPPESLPEWTGRYET
jgi:hypothetical protein